MSNQRHVIKRQILEITPAKKSQAWSVQQTLSRIFKQQMSAILDRCLSEASSPECLHQIERMELDLGTLDGRYLEKDFLQRFETTLIQALAEQISDAPEPATPAATEQTDPLQEHWQLFEQFVREGLLPWWADSSQSQLPEKSFKVLLNSDADALTRLLAELISEPHCRQRLISQFDDTILSTLITLLSTASLQQVTALLQTLQAVQAQLQTRCQISASVLRTGCLQSLLQVVAGHEPEMSRQAKFFSAVTARWAALQNLPQEQLVSSMQQLPSDSLMTDNPWLSAVKQWLEDKTPVPAAPKQPAAATVNKRYLLLKKRRHLQSRQPDNTTESAASTVDNADTPAAAALSNRYQSVKKPYRFYSAEHKPAEYNSATASAAHPFSAAETDLETTLETDSRHKPTSLVNKLRTVYAKQRKEHTTEAAAADNSPKDSATAAQTTLSNRYPQLKIQAISTQPTAPVSSDTEIDTNVFAVPALSSRYGLLKKSASLPSASNKTTADINSIDTYPKASEKPVQDFHSTRQQQAKQSAEQFNTDAAATAAAARRNANVGAASKPANRTKTRFNETDALYINNAGLCLLWPFLETFFEHQQLVKAGQFLDQTAQHTAVSLLHYLATEELQGPEYMLPFNKLLCAMALDEVFEQTIPLTTAQTQAADELLRAVIDNAPILNDMSVNGFRGSFLLRKGAVSTSMGSWLLRVEPKAYDVVLERFPWTWQWLKLPWMDFPLRVEWS